MAAILSLFMRRASNGEANTELILQGVFDERVLTHVVCVRE